MLLIQTCGDRAYTLGESPERNFLLVLKIKNSSHGKNGSIDENIESAAKYNPQVNKILDINYKDFYTKGAKSLIEMRYGSDLQFFNYMF